MGDAKQTGAQRGFRRTLIGLVTSNKADKTVTVEVTRRYLGSKYKKYLRARKRYQAHDEVNEYVVGDRVEIQEHRPFSKHKRWIVTKLIAGSVERERVQ